MLTPLNIVLCRSSGALDFDSRLLLQTLRSLGARGFDTKSYYKHCTPTERILIKILRIAKWRNYEIQNFRHSPARSGILFFGGRIPKLREQTDAKKIQRRAGNSS